MRRAIRRDLRDILCERFGDLSSTLCACRIAGNGAI